MNVVPVNIQFLVLVLPNQPQGQQTAQNEGTHVQTEGNLSVEVDTSLIENRQEWSQSGGDSQSASQYRQMSSQHFMHVSRDEELDERPVPLGAEAVQDMEEESESNRDQSNSDDVSPRRIVEGLDSHHRTNVPETWTEEGDDDFYQTASTEYRDCNDQAGGTGCYGGARPKDTNTVYRSERNPAQFERPDSNRRPQSPQSELTSPKIRDAFDSTLSLGSKRSDIERKETGLEYGPEVQGGESTKVKEIPGQGPGHMLPPRKHVDGRSPMHRDPETHQVPYFHSKSDPYESYSLDGAAGAVSDNVKNLGRSLPTRGSSSGVDDEFDKLTPAQKDELARRMFDQLSLKSQSNRTEVSNTSLKKLSDSSLVNVPKDPKVSKKARKIGDSNIADIGSNIPDNRQSAHMQPYIDSQSSRSLQSSSINKVPSEGTLSGASVPSQIQHVQSLPEFHPNLVGPDSSGSRGRRSGPKLIEKHTKVRELPKGILDKLEICLQPDHGPHGKKNWECIADLHGIEKDCIKYLKKHERCVTQMFELEDFENYTLDDLIKDLDYIKREDVKKVIEELVQENNSI